MLSIVAGGTSLCIINRWNNIWGMHLDNILRDLYGWDDGKAGSTLRLSG